MTVWRCTRCNKTWKKTLNEIPRDCTAPGSKSHFLEVEMSK